MSPAELRAWRERKGFTQSDAYVWYVGHEPLDCVAAELRFRRSAARAWRRWEAGERTVPAPLAARIRSGKKR